MMRFSIPWLALALAVAAPAASAQPADTLALSLDEAVIRAQRDADEARLAAAQVDAADAQITAARATGLPQLRLTSTYNHQIENARAQAVGQIFGQANTYNTNLNLSQALFQGGRVVAASRAASRVGEAARLDLEEARRALTVDVQRAYFEAVLAAQLVEIQERNLALADARLAQVQRLEQGGRAARYDVLRARVERSNLEPLVIQARSSRELALLELKRLLNLPVERPLALTTRLDGDAVLATLGDTTAAAAAAAPAAAPAAPVPSTASPALAAVPRDLVEGRPSVRAARLTAEARHFGISVARADRLPSVTIAGVFGYQAYPTGGFLANVPTQFGRVVATPCPTAADPTRTCNQQNGGWFSDRAVSLAVSWPLFDGLRTRANIELAEAQTRVAELQLEQQREAVTLEIARARTELARARAAYLAQRQNVAEAEEAYRLAALRFERGLATQLEASDAQLAQLTAQSNAVRASYDLFLAAAELARAEGRPIPTPPATAAAPAPPSTRRTP
ncbi:MAG TPA: TolC family protein [Gemmatimonadaceae bacterium]|nr:TolC family protein [Gemmatimonadaceae bacterium]